MHAIGCTLKQAWGPLAEDAEPPALEQRTRAHRLPHPAPAPAPAPAAPPRPRAPPRAAAAPSADPQYELRRLALFTALGIGTLFLMDLSVRAARVP
jgi:hypothetical protein